MLKCTIMIDMSASIECDDEEDEDVVMAGSELHEALSKMGYSDYEVATVASSNQELTASVDSYKSAPKRKSDGWIYEILYTKIFGIYRCAMKDHEFLRKQLTIISEAQHLLADHADFIRSLLKDNCKIEASATNYFPFHLQYVAAATVGYYFINRSIPFTGWLILTVPALTIARYKYTKWRTDRDLKRLLSEQTELHYSYKRALRILNHSFRMSRGLKQSGSTFTDIAAEKLKFLQPITEKTVKSLGTMSTAYYETTLKIVELLPDSYRQNLDSQITYFDKECFTNCGELTYDSLKQLFYRFVLIQSEMLVSLALIRHADPNNFSDEIKRGLKIDHRVKQLLELTTAHRISMVKIVGDFQKHKLTVVDNKYRGGFPSSKWQDLYVRLHLTSDKMRKAYGTITSVLEEIENHIDRRSDETELMETLKIKLEDVCKDADKAKDLVLLSSLIISKMAQNRKDEGQHDVDNDNNPAEISRRAIPMVKDSDPEIVDEVFEEYIRERYSEALLNEDGDDYFGNTSKLDKLLSRNLMSELKEALVDKQKDTKEREARALKRMNKNPEEETSMIKDDDVSNGDIPLDTSGTETESSPSKRCSMDTAEAETLKLNHVRMPPPPPLPLPMPSDFGRSKKELSKDEEKEELRPECFNPLSSSGAIPLPLFLSNNEETFIGSGENSADEEVLGESEECEDEGEEVVRSS